MENISRRNALAGLGVVMLSGCGGGSDGSPTSSAPSAPPPPPPPPPTPPPPPPPPPVGSFGTLGVTGALTYATVGHSYRGVGSGWDFILEAGSYSADPGEVIRYSPAEGLVLAVRDIGEGPMVADDRFGNIDDAGNRTSARFTVIGGEIWLYPAYVEATKLQYTGLANFASRPYDDQYKPFTMISFAYGIGVSPGAAPSTGAREYVVPRSTEGKLRVDFAAKTVTGVIRGYGDRDFDWLLDKVALSDDRTQFMGNLVNPATNAVGSIEGHLNGPTGEEMMLQVRFDQDSSLSLIFGVRNA